MSELKQQIGEETKAAMKARDKQRVGTLRMVNAEIKRIEVDERRELSDDDVISILNTMLKQRKDSLQQYQEASRQDLADQEAYEIEVISSFMPQPLSDEELSREIEACVQEVEAQGMQDMGKVMGIIKGKVHGRADMGKVSQLVKASLQNL
ncbi:MAG: GatB/YqeY domain-containing protein [Pseudomonadota bacterium]